GLARADVFFARWPRLSKQAWVMWALFFPLALFGRSEPYRIRHESPTAHHRWLDSQLLACLSDAPMVASQALVPHVSDRHWIHDLPGDAGCVLFDSSVNNWPMTGSALDSLRSELERRGYRGAYSCGSLQLYQAADSPACLTCMPQCL